MSETEPNKVRPQVRIDPDVLAWIDEEHRKREKVLGKRKVWPADVVRDAIQALQEKLEWESSARPEFVALKRCLESGTEDEKRVVLNTLLKYMPAKAKTSAEVIQIGKK